MRTPRFLGLLALALLGACVHRPALARFDASTPMATVILLDTKDGTQVEGLPPEVSAAVTAELGRRNLVADPVAVESLLALTQSRASKTRTELLAQALGPHRYFLLVELKANFFGQFAGGYKWNIDGQLTVTSSDAVPDASTGPLGVSTFLDQESEGAPEALQKAAPAIADKVGILLDDHFAGRLPVSAAPK